MKILEILKEVEKVNYDNWDHQESADYSKYLEKHFGPPDEFTNEQTVWHGIDGFKRVVCRDEYILHGSPAPHYDFVYSYIDLEVDEDLSDELAKCSGSILIDHLKNEVGARCGSLTANAVTLNFCLDVVYGRTEPVKEEYEKRILEMRAMFDRGEKYELEWWPDKAGDADPNNPFYKDDDEMTAEGTRCWKGYKRKGFKTMFGKRVPNCVKREGKYFVNDAFGELVFESLEKENAINFLRQNYLELKACAIHDNISESSHAGLRAWFGKGKKGGAGGGGWDRYNTKGERIGKCGDRKKGEGKPKCLSKARAASLRASGGKKAIAAAVRRKRKKDKNPERRGKAINVANKRKKK